MNFKLLKKRQENAEKQANSVLLDLVQRHGMKFPSARLDSNQLNLIKECKKASGLARHGLIKAVDLRKMILDGAANDFTYCEGVLLFPDRDFVPTAWLITYDKKIVDLGSSRSGEPRTDGVYIGFSFPIRLVAAYGGCYHYLDDLFLVQVCRVGVALNLRQEQIWPMWESAQKSAVGE